MVAHARAMRIHVQIDCCEKKLSADMHAMFGCVGGGVGEEGKGRCVCGEGGGGEGLTSDIDIIDGATKPASMVVAESAL